MYEIVLYLSQNRMNIIDIAPISPASSQALDRRINTPLEQDIRLWSGKDAIFLQMNMGLKSEETSWELDSQTKLPLLTNSWNNFSVTASQIAMISDALVKIILWNVQIYVATVLVVNVPITNYRYIVFVNPSPIHIRRQHDTITMKMRSQKLPHPMKKWHSPMGGKLIWP